MAFGIFDQYSTKVWDLIGTGNTGAYVVAYLTSYHPANTPRTPHFVFRLSPTVAFVRV
jgi:hypothetical protein